MLKKIPTGQLRLGMFLERFEAQWLDHPFWRTRFLLEDPADLVKVRHSVVRECWIDVSRGLDVPDPSAASTVAPRSSPLFLPPPSPDVPHVVGKPPRGTNDFADEVRRAADVCRNSRAAVQALFEEARMGRALDPSQCLELVEQVSESVFRNPGALISLARLKTTDDYTYMHSVAVCALMVALGQALDFDAAACREAGLAGLLHDMGKARMPTEVLNKPGKLTDAEYGIMKTHPVLGHQMLLEGGGAGAGALDVCLHHHERMDGAGYPHGLVGDAISRLARMGAICDVYDAITSNRPYKSGWDPAESVARMASWKGHFDPVIFQAFVRSLGIYPTGSLVRLQSGKLAVVVAQHESSLIAPQVRAFFSTKSQMHIPPQLIDLSRPGTAERIVGRESPDRWPFRNLDELWADPQVLRASK